MNINGNLNVEWGRLERKSPTYWYQMGNILNILTQLINWINNGGTGGSLTIQDVTPTTGQTITSNGSNVMALAPAGTLSTLTIVVPSSPTNGQIWNLNSTQVITALTLSGGTLQGYTTPTTFNIGVQRWIYDASQSQWLLN